MIFKFGTGCHDSRRQLSKFVKVRLKGLHDYYSRVQQQLENYLKTIV